MQKSIKILRIFIYTLIFSTSTVLTACGTPGISWQNCSFGFDLRYDHQDAYVLDYKLSSDRYTLVAADKYYVDKGTHLYFQNVIGMVDRPSHLWVKWHDNITDRTYEDTIELKNILPRYLDDTRIYFIIRGAKIYVYLKTKELLPEHISGKRPMVGAEMYSGNVNILLYPKEH